MTKTHGKKRTAVVEDDAVEVRVSTRTPKARVATPPVTRAQNLAAGLLDALIGQVADYVEHSHAVERLIRAQTGQVLRELAQDPHLTNLIRTQAEAYVAELVAHPEILEPLVRTQVDRYLEHLRNEPELRRALTERVTVEEVAPPKVSKRKKRAGQITIE